MEETIKYFQPDITDIRVGYECESFWNQDHLPTNEWFPIIVGELGTEDIDWNYRINNKTIRVPYLTKEQIEAEGWKLSFDFSTLGTAHSMDFEKGDVWKDAGDGAFLSWNPHNSMIKIITTDIGYNRDGPNNSIKFKGECKDINTFRYICKLLNIK